MGGGWVCGEVGYDYVCDQYIILVNSRTLTSPSMYVPLALMASTSCMAVVCA